MRSGFKFALDGLHNVPNELPYAGLCCLHPPGSLYQTNVDSTQISLNSTIDWDSPVSSLKFLEGFVTYKDVKFDKNLCIIVDIKTIKFKNPTTSSIIDVGWTILPVFSPDGYVLSGIYQVPIFQGVIPKEIIDSLPLNDPWPYLMEELAKKKSKLKYLEPMSAIVRLLDGQREVYLKLHSNLFY